MLNTAATVGEHARSMNGYPRSREGYEAREGATSGYVPQGPSIAPPAGLAIGLSEVHHHAHAGVNHQAQPESSSGTSNLWGYTVPSPPRMGQATHSVKLPPGFNGTRYQQTIQGYNLSNT